MRDALARHDAIVRGATAVRGDFLLGPANVPVMGEICRRLDGISRDGRDQRLSPYVTALPETDPID
jgi:hypothetical protein